MPTAKPAVPFAGAILLAVVSLALALPQSARPAAGPLSIEVLNPSQQSLLTSGRVKARISSEAPGTAVVKPRVIVDGTSRKLGRKRRVELGENAKNVALRLSAAGRQLVAACGAKTLMVKARFTADASAAGDGARKAKGSTRRSLAIDSTACRQSAPSGGGGGGVDNSPPPAQPYTGPAIDTANSARCDYLDSAICLQPWPNDYFTVEDTASDTDRRLNLNLLSMPSNDENVPIDNAEINRNDGFSPGNMIITRVPGLDNLQAFEQTGAVGIDDLHAYDDAAQPVVVINADTGQRHPVWAEIDFNPKDRRPNPGDDAAARSLTNLLIRPAVNFEEGQRYVVALRNLKDENGTTIQPSNAFKVFRDNLTTTDPAIEGRRAKMEGLFEDLEPAGIPREDLYLTWDFTVASERNLSERMLHVRDEAFSALGDDDMSDLAVDGTSPGFSVTGTEVVPPCSAGMGPQCEDGEDDRIDRIVTGSVTVPCFLNNASCAPAGGSFAYNPADTLNPDRLPVQAPGNEATADFQCMVPRSALSGGDANPARPSLYGHGLLGSHTEVGGGQVRAMVNEHNFIYCATDWAGFSTLNAPNILAILQDLSLFPLLADHSQQGFLNMMFLGRALIHPDGLSTDPAFQDGDGDPLIDTTRLFYDGNSQGGILGGGLTAVAPDFDQAVLGVPAMNYSTLLRRSVDFEPYAEGKFTDIVCDELPEPFKTACNNDIIADSPFGLYDNYPDELERPLILSLIQLMWDRAEANGYAHHMTTDPLADTPAHNVLLHVAFGDHQVANVAAEVEARTIGASVYEPALDATDTDPIPAVDTDPRRHWDVDPFLGIPTVPAFPFRGSALVYWDGGPLGFDDPFDGDTDNDGSATPPDTNIPPRPPTYGADPHSYPRNDVKSRAQRSAFMAVNGVLRNPCTTANLFVSPPMPIAFGTGTPIPCYANGYLGP